jgi:hypothetical protein
MTIQKQGKRLRSINPVPKYRLCSPIRRWLQNKQEN